MAQLKQAVNLVITGDENSGPTQSMGKASGLIWYSKHFTRAPVPDNSRLNRLLEILIYKQAVNLINAGDENRGSTQSLGEASGSAGISEHITKAGDKARGERLQELRSQCLTDREFEIQSSQEHWTEVETEAAFDDVQLEETNREVFERLMEQWRCPETGLCFFHDWGENLQVGRKITEGGQAEIFEAEIEGDPGYVVKVFKKGYSLKDLEHQWPRGMFQTQPLDSSRFCSEDKAKEASVSTHFIYKNCCFIHGATLLRNGRFAFVLERYWGDLRRYIDLQIEAGCDEPFRDDRVRVYIMLEIAKGMLMLHRRGILHRDLKASNVLLRSLHGGPLDRISFSSFWESRAVVVDVADFESSSAIVGTGFWRAPEVLSALKDRTSMLVATPWTKKSDVYAYAMTCYEVLTGHIPFESVHGINNDSIINGVRPPWFDSSEPVESDLRALVMRCWDSNPSERPEFAQIVNQLDRKCRSAYRFGQYLGIPRAP